MEFICDQDIESSPYVFSNQNTDELKKSENQPTPFQDTEFPPNATSIKGSISRTVKCRCNQAPVLSFIDKPGSSNNLKPYYHCSRKKCSFFTYAYIAEQNPWFRFGANNDFVLVKQENRFEAQDLLQGRVGDCWFLSALAVIAQRDDLIRRLFFKHKLDRNGKIEIRLFIDGWWRSIFIDNFLPCSLHIQNLENGKSTLQNESVSLILSSINIKSINSTYELLQCKYGQKYGLIHPYYKISEMEIQNKLLQVKPISSILSYSKSKHNQLWVPFLEKAYAKYHGCYQSISGGEISEAFLDLTGCPTLTFNLHSSHLQGKDFWKKLMNFRKQTLPMGCATGGGRDLNEVGLVGHHAYSILDVREFHISPYTDIMSSNSRSEIGNVSGFGDDGILRLLKIRNPHGKGEWKGAWSDQSCQWQTLLRSTSGKDASFMHQNDLCSMKNDGMFWMDYDHFLMGFHIVDVCLAFPNMHAKSFASSFPPKKSPYRSVKAFRVDIPDFAIIDVQKEKKEKDFIDVYAMSIQKTRRGIYSGQTDKKKSYKFCDSGFLVLYPDGNVSGALFGMKKNGHFKFVLNRSKPRLSSAIVVPITFGHPSASDKELSFTVRFVGSGPLRVKPLEKVPELSIPLQKFCFNAFRRRILAEEPRIFRVYLCENMGSCFLYLIVSDDYFKNSNDTIRLQIVANVRGMSCRSESGLLNHKVISKGKKFEAAWRQFNVSFEGENKSRLLLVLVQSGQDWEVGPITVDHPKGKKRSITEHEHQQRTIESFMQSSQKTKFHPDSTQNTNLKFENKSGVFGPITSALNTFSPQKPSTIDINTVQEEHEVALAIENSMKDHRLISIIDVESFGRSFVDTGKICRRKTKDSEAKASIKVSDTVENIINHENDDQLQKAIMLSLAGETIVSKEANNLSCESQKVVIDIASGSTFHNISQKKESDIVDLLSSDDEICIVEGNDSHKEEVKRYEGKEKIERNEKVSSIDLVTTNVNRNTIATKRKLALEAAEKRLRFK